MDDFSKYEALRDQGASPRAVYAMAKADGLNEIVCTRMLRRIFELSLGDVKEIRLASTWHPRSIEEHEARLLPGLERAMRDMGDETDAEAGMGGSVEDSPEHPEAADRE